MRLFRCGLYQCYTDSFVHAFMRLVWLWICNVTTLLPNSTEISFFGATIICHLNGNLRNWQLIYSMQNKIQVIFQKCMFNVTFALITKLLNHIQSIDKRPQICIRECIIVIFGFEDVNIRLESEVNFSSWFAIRTACTFHSWKKRNQHTHYYFFRWILCAHPIVIDWIEIW